MNELETKEQTKDLVFEFELDAPPKKVWRAISLPEFRDIWLPKGDLADAAPISSAPDEEVSYRMKDNEPPFLESEVTFQVRPDGDGGTILRVIHVLLDEQVTQQPLKAANNNRPVMMHAA
ncbi:SRPBCC domain-containing protein [Pelagibius sp. Alg239-R121]|uniref:SRPBCC family protein n=1 Tax=Pelagibius sp. Alg239-R121 TaxID=2993448 RepID=UPI0024A6DD49|nr:polyketide cyclase [Pelagibius sp. Alg239-R121]